MKTKARTIKNGSKTGILAAMLILSLVFSTSSCDGVNVIVDEDVPADNLPVNAMLYNDDYTLDDGPIKGGSARVHATPIDTLNPLLTQNTYTREIMGLIYEGLFEIDPQLEERPLLAYSYRVSEDGLTWTIDLKQNVKWHDGREFTSADVLYTVSMIQDYGDESVYAPLVTNISRIEAEGDHRVIIRLYKVNSFTPMALIFPIVPSHVPLTDGLYMEWMRISEILVGTGPYKAANYQFGESISLHINESWNSQVGNSAVGGGRFSYAMSGGSAGVNNSSEINGGAGLSNSAGVNGGSTSMNNSAGVNGG
ncbi:MAG: ABC transporter substrate-binding protein, partial [Oscillospiraceae bacterium]|nr:ABC transporter substrate-binding protein [Oscillospiraceae bacterium]